MLRAVNDAWMEHLQMIDYIREGISLRGYAQVDPLVAYKKETFDLFQHTLKAIRDSAVKMVFRASIQVQPQGGPSEAAGDPDLEPAMQMVALDPTGGEFDVNSVDWKSVARNDLCPCGSGKKFKACHYPIVRSMGLI